MLYYKFLIDELSKQTTKAAADYALNQKGDADHNNFAAKQTSIIEKTLPKLLALKPAWVDVEGDLEEDDEEKIPDWESYNTQFKQILSDADAEGERAIKQEPAVEKLSLDYLHRYTNGLRNIKKQLDTLFKDDKDDNTYAPHQNQNAKDYTSVSVEESSLINQFLHLLMMYRIEKWVLFKVKSITEPTATSEKKFRALESTFKSWDALLKKDVEGDALDSSVDGLLIKLIENEKKAQLQAEKRGKAFAFLKGWGTSLAQSAGYQIGGVLGDRIQKFKERFEACRPYTGHEADKVISRAHSPF